MNKEKRGLSLTWRRFLTIWAVALLLLGLIGCLVLYRYLGVYEATRPELYMEEYMSSMTVQKLLDQMEVDSDLPVSQYEDPAALYQQYLSGLTLDGELRYAQEKHPGVNDRADFTVSVDQARLCTVTLTDDGTRRGFGRHGWKLDRVHTGDFTSFLRSMYLSICALDQQELYLNGIPLAADDLADHEAPPDLTEAESRFSPATSFSRYRIGPLYGDLVLTDRDGAEIPLRQAGDDQLSADAAAREKQALRITAPAGIRVFAGGLELDPADAQANAGIMEGLSTMVMTDYLCYTYTLPDLYGAPEVSAVDEQGHALSPVISADGQYRFFYENDPEAAAVLQPYAERFFQLFVTYTSSAFNESRYYDLLDRIRPGTALYDYVAQSRDAMIWAPYSRTEFADLHYDNFRYLNNRCFICTVRYDADISFSAKDEAYNYGLQSAYEMAFQLADTGWIALAMSAVD